jgi:hypothetical protein
MQKPIRSRKAVGEDAIDFTVLSDTLPGKLGFTDIDGVMERHGYFLFLEKKRVGVKIPTGQRILFEKLSQLPKTTVLIFWGTENDVKQIEEWHGTDHQILYNYTLQKAIICWLHNVEAENK